MTFWMRFEKIVQSLSRSDIVILNEIHFNKVLPSMKLPPSQNSTLLGTLGNKGLKDDLIELKRISAKLPDSNFLIPTDSILKTEHSLKIDDADGGGPDADAEAYGECYEGSEPLESFVGADG